MSIITHIPHSSLHIPECFHYQFECPLDELEAEIHKLNDHYTDKLFEAYSNEVLPIIFPVNRFLVDPERFENDSSEPMSAKGMGVLYTHDTNGKRFRRDLNIDERELLLNKYYRPHHRKLNQLTRESLAKNDRAIIIDCHSFPEIPLPCDANQDQPRPDICIGTDKLHTPEWLVCLVKEAFERQEFTLSLNNPYGGTLVPSDYFGTDDRVMSIMIEINKRLYLDNSQAIKTDKVVALNQTINSIYKCILEYF